MAKSDAQAGAGKGQRALSGAVLLFAGLVMLAVAWGYPTGTMTQMGPGFIPKTIAILLSVLAVAILVIDLRTPDAAPAEGVHWRGLFFVSAAVALFAGLVDLAGLVPSMFLAVAVSMCADPQARPLSVLIYAVIATGLGWLLFLVGLDLPIPAFWR